MAAEAASGAGLETVLRRAVGLPPPERRPEMGASAHELAGFPCAGGRGLCPRD